jgi:hypothetical protein
MTKQQMSLLFLGSLVGWTIGNGLLPILPIYAVRLGATSAIAGNCMAFSYLALAADRHRLVASASRAGAKDKVASAYREERHLIKHPDRRKIFSED